MPKIVDHNAQKEKVAQAAWRVIHQHGLEYASVRNIAEEAGLSSGSLRHYFATQSELFAFAMKLVTQRVNERISRISFTGDVLKDAPLLVDEILPLEEETRQEMEVWFAFVVKSFSDPTLGSLRSQVDEDMRRLFSTIVHALVQQELAPLQLDQELETERFYGLIDGLAMHAVMRPEKLTPDLMRSVVKRHLYSICKPEIAAACLSGRDPKQP
ncbi:TetR family transcriptional regulator [Paenibacillus sp. F411]|uniref:TetR/AcrR family transcriptional regulator n=1 Tax=Paenibacillus sp. F411 TaxID=2820239 RepID=UPI001AAEC20D|nr:TetR/AcrR family transcriptional regulator [Paenibacillus sp. F411]MBO2945980.1 TetR family transcriptional regulator [Paenibacillus sp. F411]